MTQEGAIGLVVNPMSGRDVRRLVGRAHSETLQSKRNILQRALVGAAAAGAERICWTRDSFRLAESALEYVDVGVRLERLETGALHHTAEDTRCAVEAMRAAGSRVLLVLGGDGTNRVVADTWPDAVLMPFSIGTNNVFPKRVEATLAGAAAGLLASGRLAPLEAARRSKRVHLERAEGTAPAPAVVDAVLVEDDHPGSLLPFDAEKIRSVVLARAEPDSVGMSPIGGLLMPCRDEDDFGVALRCTAPGAGGKALLAPISPGLYRNAYVESVRRIELGEQVTVRGPGVVELDGDRELALAAGEAATLCVLRDGPWVIDVRRALTLAAERGFYLNRSWHDAADQDAGGMECC